MRLRSIVEFMILSSFSQDKKTAFTNSFLGTIVSLIYKRATGIARSFLVGDSHVFPFFLKSLFDLCYSLFLEAALDQQKARVSVSAAAGGWALLTSRLRI
jgi:hypothetical protein